MRTLLKMLLLPPDVLLVHARAYSDFSRQACLVYLCALKKRWVLWGLSALALVLAGVFGGVALMLWSALPLHAAPQAWVLLALPGFCLLLSVGFGWWACRQRLPPLWQELQIQLAMDFPGRMPTALDRPSDMTPAQRLAVSRAQMAQALRDPAWLLLLQRWLQGIQPSHAAAAAAKGASVGAKAEPEA